MSQLPTFPVGEPRFYRRGDELKYLLKIDLLWNQCSDDSPEKKAARIATSIAREVRYLVHPKRTA